MMQTRFEYKFFLSWPEYQHMKQFVSMVLQQDREPYAVNSLYFDTENLLFYNQKVNGEYFHHKIRLRQYSKNWDHQERAWLEMKSKRDDAQLKTRLPLLKADDWKSHENLWLPLTNGSPIKPLCFVLYFREAFDGPHKEQRLRVTFDHSLTSWAWHLPSSKGQELIQQQVLMEIKHDQREIPDFLYRQIKNLKCERIRFSKYAQSMDFLYA